ncbi:aminotransferase class I/II-fold pyridoxal phosphate-dependent enzyme [Atopobacter phocae]|uniref:aminotransferase class I/II-fold pyridoxal phosphate-dependent enzyme n=1 Tax=Atopobacter phocae TaxID=136492 RepID=UPI00046FA08A|nr:aminotransferase class I/II-fold pyridoxal phosphate-dependent enzyme [Atopobacter phocae]
MNKKYIKILHSIIDMTRGKPATDQLMLSEPMYECITPDVIREYIDYFNYGGVLGIPEARQLFADVVGVTMDDVLVNDNSSLKLMNDLLTWYMLFGVGSGATPWRTLESVRFLCPVPGYDRHFKILEQLGIEMINIRMLPDGPDMDQVEALVANDPAIKGIICVPTYSNPEGITFSNEVVERLATLTPAADDFRIFYDDAYHFHHLDEDYLTRHQANLFKLAQTHGTADRVLIFLSTSKITIPGAGISALITSPANMAYLVQQLSIQSIGPNKVNQLQHVLFLKDAAHLEQLMQQHAQLLLPKFQIVNDYLTRYFGETDRIQWMMPHGGYFISLKCPKGTAKRIIKTCLEHGVKLTPAGSEFPYQTDPDDHTIRLAPTYLTRDELEQAMHIVCEVIQAVLND